MELDRVDAIAVTRGPGLPGALIVGMATAKALAYGAGKPLIGVNHLEGHMYANYFEHADLAPPFVALIVSGGHTLLAHVKEWGSYDVMGQTLDDATGEAYDKVANYLGLGYPGGPIIEDLARQGDPAAVKFPRAMIHTPDYNFSLSGLKTAVLYHVTKQEAAGAELNLPDLAASFQAAVLDVQIHKTMKAVDEADVNTVVLAGGVAANNAMRDGLAKACAERGARLFYPALNLCTDNAVMIGSAASRMLRSREFLPLSAEPDPNLPLN